MKKIDYELTELLGVISSKRTDNKTTTIELNKISWNGSSPKNDLRIWSTDNETGERKPFKGLTLDDNQLQALYNALKAIFSD